MVAQSWLQKWIRLISNILVECPARSTSGQQRTSNVRTYRTVCTVCTVLYVLLYLGRAVRSIIYRTSVHHNVSLDHTNSYSLNHGISVPSMSSLFQLSEQCLGTHAFCTVSLFVLFYCNSIHAALSRGSTTSGARLSNCYGFPGQCPSSIVLDFSENQTL